MKFQLIIISLIIFIKGYSQEIPLNRNLVHQQERLFVKEGIDFFTENKPYNISEIKLKYYYNHDSGFTENIKSRWLKFVWRKLRRESLIRVNTEDVKLSIDPLFHFSYGKFKQENSDQPSSTYMNTRGFIIRGSIGKNFSFSSSLYENQGRFADYINEKINQNKVIPGEGVWKPFKENAYDYASVNGIISWKASDAINISFGNDKNFIGDGYRSLLLSDNSFNYPFLKIKISRGKFQYSNLYSSYQIALNKFSYSYGSAYHKKYSTTHLLSYNPFKGFNASIFESTIWKATENGKARAFKLVYLNPIIGAQTIAFGLDGIDNTLLGINLRYNFLKSVSVYSQFLLDETKTQKYGYQFGVKYFDIFKIENLSLQAEYNYVNPFTYTHKDSIQNYSHYNQSLTAATGNNFREGIIFLNYRYKDIFLETQLLYAQKGTDNKTSKYGQNINLSDYSEVTGNEFPNGIETEIIFTAFRLNFLVNPATNMNLYFEFANRIEQSGTNKNSNNYYSFGFRTSLNNYYYDF